MNLLGTWAILLWSTLQVHVPQSLWVAAASRNDLKVRILQGTVDAQIQGPFYLRHLPLFQVTLQGQGVAELQVPDPFVVHPGKYYSVAFARLYQNLVVNRVEVIPPPASPSSRAQGGRVLVITPSTYVDSLQAWLEWKQQRGVSTVVATLEETGANFVTLHAFLQNAYQNWEIPPEYVVLVGDENTIPPVTVYDSLGCEEYYPIDNPYAQLEGDDYLADVMLGRLPVRTLADLSHILHKILTYERNPDTLNPWLEKAVFFSGDLFEPDSMYAMAKDSARMVLESLGFTYVDTFYYRTTGQDLGDEDVLNALAEGRGFLNHRANAAGHLFPPWDNVDAHHAFTGEHYPIVVIPTCSMGNFILSNHDYGEVWLTLYEPDAGKGGGVAYISTSGCVFGMEGDPYFHTFRRNALDVGFFRGLLDMPSPSLSYLLEAGRIHLLTQYPLPAYWAQYHYEEFLMLGDPELRPWKRAPHAVEVSYPTHSSTGVFTVQVSRNGVPVENAYVTFFRAGQITQDTTDAAGLAHLTVQDHGVYQVTVTGDGIYPFQGLAFFGPDSAPELTLLATGITDVLQGNGNDIPNPAETLNVVVQLSNLGAQPATDVSLSVHPLTSALYPVDSIQWIPVLPPSTILTDSSLAFALSPTAPTGVPQRFLLVVAQGQQTLLETLTVIPRDLRIRVVGVSFLSPSNPVDSIPMPGDTGPWMIGVENQEPFVIPGLSLTLRTYTPGIAVLDSTSSAPPLPPGETVWTTDDPFVLSIDPSVLEGTWIQCTLQVTFPNGVTGTLDLETVVGKIDYVVLPLAATSSSPDVLDSTLNTLGYRGFLLDDALKFPWIERNTDAVFLCAGTYPFHQDLSPGLLPDALMRAATRGALMYIEGNRIFFQKDTIPFLSMFPVRYEMAEMVEGLDSLRTSDWAPFPILTFGYDTAGVESYTKVLAAGSGSIIAMFAYGTQTGGLPTSFPGAYLVELDSLHGMVMPFEFGRLLEHTPSARAVLLDSLMQHFGIMPGVAETSSPHPSPVLRIFPNPTMGQLLIQSPDPYRLTVYDLAGRKVLSVEGRGGLASQVIPLHLPSGTYFIQLETDRQKVLRKQVVIRASSGR